MTRVKRTSNARKKQQLFQFAKGYKGSSSSLRRFAKQRVERALVNAYCARRLRKRYIRSLWIKRINAALSDTNIGYSQAMFHINIKDIKINRKILSQLALYDRNAFSEIITI
jgi:large subunit ribosomal protein L20